MQTAEWRKGVEVGLYRYSFRYHPAWFFTHVLQSGEELGEAPLVQLSGTKWVASFWTLTSLF